MCFLKRNDQLWIAKGVLRKVNGCFPALTGWCFRLLQKIPISELKQLRTCLCEWRCFRMVLNHIEILSLGPQHRCSQKLTHGYQRNSAGPARKLFPWLNREVSCQLFGGHQMSLNKLDSTESCCSDSPSSSKQRYCCDCKLRPEHRDEPSPLFSWHKLLQSKFLLDYLTCNLGAFVLVNQVLTSKPLSTAKGTQLAWLPKAQH